jgi:enoyl-CoA hydratase/carnithine racemase
MPGAILTQHNDPWFEIILNRPEKRNALDWPMLAALEQAVEQAGRTPGVRAVLVRGEGAAFSAGVDLRAFTDLGETFGAGWQQRMLGVTAAFQAILNKVERCTAPTIALLHGHALGLGLELALACDFRIAAQGTQIGLPEVRLGLIPDVGGTTRLARLVGPARAKELVMTGKTIEPDLAERWGLVNSAVPEGELRAKALELAGELARAAPLAVNFAKQVINGLEDVERGLQLEAWAQSQLIQTEDFQAGIQAMIARTPPDWKGK